MSVDATNRTAFEADFVAELRPSTEGRAARLQYDSETSSRALRRRGEALEDGADTKRTYWYAVLSAVEDINGLLATWDRWQVEVELRSMGLGNPKKNPPSKNVTRRVYDCAFTIVRVLRLEDEDGNPYHASSIGDVRYVLDQARQFLGMN